MRPVWLVLVAGCFRFDSSSDPPGQQVDAPPPVVADATPDAPLTPSQVVQALLEEWSGCLSMDNFVNAKMNDWGTLQASTGQTCQTCHDTGGDGFIATTNLTLFFTTISQHKFYLLQYFTVDLSQGTESAKVIVNQTSFTAVGTAAPPHDQHPTFNPTTNTGMTALSKLHDATLARKLAGQCDPPRLLD